MKPIVWIFVLALLQPIWAVAAETKATPAASSEATQRWLQYEPEFARFATADRENPPRKGEILFVGSSIFREWTTLSENMAPWPVRNRAFGGSRTDDQLARFDQLVPPYAPRLIVYYCGSNDINANGSASDIVARFVEFVRRVHRDLPHTPVLYVSILRAPQKNDHWNVVDDANQRARAYCATDPRLRFIDLSPAVFDAAGEPRMELYRPDKLHYLPPAYEAFTAIIKPVVAGVWREVQPDAISP